ncbi:hypothetical protein ACFDR9_005088 [Janthinobacterium sp. CG_23.3]|uniref:hypothetical protein n=1 Tax=Janthinobacterium sp. CG_23.3 TaxID=3349634 RepID=UPI0038D431C7
MKKAQIVDLFGRILLVVLLVLALLAVDMAFAWAAPAYREGECRPVSGPATLNRKQSQRAGAKAKRSDLQVRPQG